MKGLLKMTRTVEVYFKSENDAASASASLQRLKTHNMFTDPMTDDYDTKMIVPFFPTAIHDLGATTNMASADPGVVGMVETENKDKNVKLTHLLQFDVEESDYEEALWILKEHECYHRKPQ